jgi:DNA replication protein DnaC
MANSTKKRQTRKSSKKPKAAGKAKTAVSSSVVGTSFRDIFAEMFGRPPQDYDAIVEFRKLKDKERVREARKIIQASIINAVEQPDARFSLAVAESETLLNGYATLDDQHRAEIQKLIKQITAYLRDSTRKRPFNALMLAAPGAGKSHFIKQLASSMKEERVQAVTFNMATMQSADDMAQPVDELRNLKVNDRFPLLFLDEFDSDPSRYAALLPLLWDGELQIGHRDLKLGKAVIVLAGSNPDLPKAMDQSAKMRLETDTGEGFIPTGKLIDLLSRINGGVINIPDLDLRSEHRDRRVDKVCVAISLIKARFGQDISEIPRSLLRFIAQTTFRYGVRSIAHLIDVIESDAFDNKALKANALGLPIVSETALQESSLRLHLLDKDQGFGIVNRWKEVSKDKAVVNVRESPLQHIITS